MTPPLIARARSFRDRTAVVEGEGTLTYGRLLDDSAALARDLLDGASDLGEAPVPFLVPPSADWVVTQWGIWRAGGLAVPLALSHPLPELAFVLDDTTPDVLVTTTDLEPRIRPLATARRLRVIALPSSTRTSVPSVSASDGTETELPRVVPDRAALMIYTSGTTGRPKGVVTTHGNVAAQITSLATAWCWSDGDRVLLTLPLHHVHGIVNVVSCALWSGACCEMHPGFDAAAVWERFAQGGLTLYMAVPTIYARLIAAWEHADDATRERWSAGAQSLRLMVSGSAALPTSVLASWKDITGHTLLERYGMTEIGMGLGNPIDGPRRPGHVGVPFPDVEIRLVDEDGAPVAPGEAGEIQIRGPQVFREYWRRPAETASAFADGWFRTGDVGIVEGGSYRILGRNSVDIIKTGGEKVSALEVEEALREHASVRDCAVVGLPDPEWGEVVAAAIVPADGELDSQAVRDWARERLAGYKVPRQFVALDALPLNAMGKVTKLAVRELVARLAGDERAGAPPGATRAPLDGSRTKGAPR